MRVVVVGAQPLQLFIKAWSGGLTPQQDPLQNIFTTLVSNKPNSRRAEGRGMSEVILIKTLRSEQTELLALDKELHAITVSVCPQMCERALNRRQTLSLSQLQMRMCPPYVIYSCNGGRKKRK